MGDDYLHISSCASKRTLSTEVNSDVTEEEDSKPAGQDYKNSIGYRDDRTSSLRKTELSEDTRWNSRFHMSKMDIKTMTGCRYYAARMVKHQHFDSVMGFVICTNIIFMIYETDTNAPCAKDVDTSLCKTPAIVVSNLVYLAIYTWECAMRLFVQRLSFFRNEWNILDISVVILGQLDTTLMFLKTSQLPGPSMSILRIFRVFRLLRAMKVFQKIPELYSMLRGFASAMYSMFWGFVMIIVLLLIFSILSVELFNEYSLEVHRDNDFCRDAFGSVWKCMLMFFQTLVAGDSWGNCALPLIHKHHWPFVVFVLAQVCIQLGFMNLILAVIVERAARAKDEDEEELKREKKKEEKKATNRLLRIFEAIDTDDSGTVSLEELLEGFDNHDEMQNLFSKLDFARHDLKLLFEVMDTEGDGAISYDHMVASLKDVSLSDARKNLTMLRLESAEMQRICKKMHDKMMDKPERARSYHSGAKSTHFSRQRPVLDHSPTDDSSNLRRKSVQTTNADATCSVSEFGTRTVAMMDGFGQRPSPPDKHMVPPSSHPSLHKDLLDIHQLLEADLAVLQRMLQTITTKAVQHVNVPAPIDSYGCIQSATPGKVDQMDNHRQLEEHPIGHANPPCDIISNSGSGEYELNQLRRKLHSPTTTRLSDTEEYELNQLRAKLHSATPPHFSDSSANMI